MMNQITSVSESLLEEDLGEGDAAQQRQQEQLHFVRSVKKNSIATVLSLLGLCPLNPAYGDRNQERQ